MRVIIHTLVDITETNVRRGNSTESNQQANYNTVIQTVGLRINIVPVRVYETIETAENYKFGSLYSTRHKVWHFEFEYDYEGGINQEMLEEDFELVPFIKGLNETAPLPHQVFRTTDAAERNILFEFLE